MRDTCDSVGRLGFNAHREQRQYPRRHRLQLRLPYLSSPNCSNLSTVKENGPETDLSRVFV